MRIDPVSNLVTEMRNRINIHRAVCLAAGLDVLYYGSSRLPTEQARLYAEGRTRADVLNKADALAERGYLRFADILRATGRVGGRVVRTNAGPGESWHQFNEAVDGVPMLNGKPVFEERGPWWDRDRFRYVWDVFGRGAAKAGLAWAGNWRGFREMPHLQLRFEGNPLEIYNPDDAEKVLRERGMWE